jgi:hypothetical protein
MMREMLTGNSCHNRATSFRSFATAADASIFEVEVLNPLSASAILASISNKGCANTERSCRLAHSTKRRLQALRVT